MDRLVRFFEFVGNCPTVVASFRQCQSPTKAGCAHAPVAGATCAMCAVRKDERSISLADLKPGQSGVVTHVGAAGALRQRLLDMGILPNTTIDLERSGLGGDPLWIRCQGARLALRRAEAKAIAVRRPSA
jgi:Fe2+ transport system protein FeoA